MSRIESRYCRAVQASSSRLLRIAQRLLVRMGWARKSSCKLEFLGRSQKPLQRREDRLIGGRPLERVDLFGTEPAIAMMFGQPDFAGNEPGDEDVERDHDTVRIVRSSAEPWADLDFDRELLADLAPEGCLRRFVRFHLAAGEFPLQGAARRVRASLGSQAGAVSDDRGADHVERWAVSKHRAIS